jgi:hypothetical protein
MEVKCMINIKTAACHVNTSLGVQVRMAKKISPNRFTQNHWAFENESSIKCLICVVKSSNFKEQRPSWETSSHSRNQNIRRHLRNPKAHYRVHNNPPLVPILTHINPLHTFPPHFRKTHPNITFHLSLGLPSGLLPSDYPIKTLYTFLISPMRATCPVQLTLLDFITLTIFGEAYKLWNSSLCSLLQPPANYSLLGTNILLSILFSNRKMNFMKKICYSKMKLRFFQLSFILQPNSSSELRYY